MWNILILTAMLAVAGYFSMVDQKYVVNSEASTSVGLANGMAFYRQAVINYYTNNPGASVNTSVGELTLQSSNYFPYGANAPLLTSQWNNYIDTNHIIYIYEAAPMTVNIVSNIVTLSQNSVLAGQAVMNGTTLELYAPADIATAPPSTFGLSSGIPEAMDYGGHSPIPLPVGAAIPVGSPVWLASAN
jgi:hypothetical protein